MNIAKSLQERFLLIVERDNLFDLISNENTFNETMLKAINEENDFAQRMLQDERIKNHMMKNVYISFLLN